MRGSVLRAMIATALALAARVGADEAAVVQAPAGQTAGPALREALEAARAGEPRALDSLASVEARFPSIADHAAHQQIALRAAAQEHAAVAAAAAGFAERYADSPLLGRVAALEAEAAVALGDEARARAAFERAAAGAPSREARAELTAKIAESFERSGALTEAAAAFLRIWRDDAATTAAAAARVGLARLEKALGSVLIGAADLATRCQRLGAAYWNEEALHACDAALADETLAPAQRRSTEAFRAELLFRARRYAEAERAFAALGDERENRFWRARSLARSGRIDEAKAAFESLGEKRDALGARALFLAGTLYEDDDLATASLRFRAALAQAETAELRSEASWRLAWRAYREGRFAEAAADLAALATDTADPIEALRARYWEARALALGANAEGDARLAALARDWRFTYYGWRAAAGPQGVAAAEPDAAPQSAPDDSGAALPPEALERPRILLEAGLTDDAGAEARTLAIGATRRADRLALAALLQDTGQFDAAQRVILEAYAVELAAGPRAGDPDVWWAAYPEAFAADVARAADAHGIPRELLYAVMREESGFAPKALSVVGARGLVQIMPETGAVLATRLGYAAFTPDELFVPARNLELGAAYLAELLRRFEGRFSAVIAAYNAGPDAVGRWLAKDGALADDEWVETIPYDQTRSYAKRVLRSFAAYQALY